ncbi:MAG TPA: TonB-dependent receptor plug domain-containing protein, partial [Vicinamibacteria bacterium]|nr:TonB-dependent receptor plug domain-containing protein [Vicinamibacteria bacterium]
MTDTVIVTPAAPRRLLVAVIVAALGFGLPGRLLATSGGQAVPAPAPSPSPSPSPAATPEERAREAEREDLQAPDPQASPSPAPVTSPSPSATPEPPPPTPEPAASPKPSPLAPEPTPAAPEPAPSALPEATPPAVAPSPEPSPAEENKEMPSANLLEKLPTFRDIEDIDLTTLLKVTAGEEGTRTADDDPGLVTVVSEEDIRRTGARTVTEVLQTVPGLEVVTDSLGRARIIVRGVSGSMTSGSSENVLITLNGLRLNDSIFGG